MNIQEEIRKVKLASPNLQSQTEESRNSALAQIVTALRENKESILSANKEDMEYSKDIQSGELSAYMANSLLMVSGVPYNDNSKLLITIASRAIKSWKNNSRLRDKAFVAAFGHMTKGVDAWEHFNEYMPNRYGLILNEIITL